MKIGVKAIGSYLPYRYLPLQAIGQAWGAKASKGNKSICDVDEDAITMAVEAGLSCFGRIKRDDIDALYFASNSAPYAEKQNSSLISVALDLTDNKVFTTDLSASTRAGSNAMRLAFDTVKAKSAHNVLVVASDKRNAYPKSGLETQFGDGAAALVIGEGEDDLLAELLYQTSINEEINDYWRNSAEKYVLHAEKRFCDEEGWQREVQAVIEKTLKETGKESYDFDKVILVSQSKKVSKKVIAKYFKDEQLVDTLLNEVGDTGAAQAILALNNCLEKSEQGETVLLIDYGNGASAYIFKILKGVESIIPQIDNYLNKREILDSYARFLSWRGIAGAEPGTPYKVQPSWAQTWREQRINLRLHGSVCKKCGSALFPINRVCDKCGSKDEYEEFSAQEDIAKLYTFSIDEFAGQSDDPTIIQAVVSLKNGAHIYTLMTDFKREEVQVDMPVEFTFRKFNELGNFPNYFWKVRPIRREKL